MIEPLYDLRFWIALLGCFVLYCGFRLVWERYEVRRLVTFMTSVCVTVVLVGLRQTPPAVIAGAEAKQELRPPTIGPINPVPLAKSPVSGATSRGQSTAPVFASPTLPQSGFVGRMPKFGEMARGPGNTNITIDRPTPGAAPTGGSLFGEGQGGANIYVVDRSLSMAGDRWDEVIKHLIAHLKACPKGKTKVLVRFFSTPDDCTVIPSDGQLRTLETDADVAYFEAELGKVQPEGLGTAPRTALEHVLALEADRVYLLTDGEFNTDAVTVDATFVKKANVSAAIVDTFQVGPQQYPALQSIAESNRGAYRYYPIPSKQKED